MLLPFQQVARVGIEPGISDLKSGVPTTWKTPLGGLSKISVMIR